MYYPGLNENDKTGIWTWLYLFYGFIITLVAFIWALPIFRYHLCPQNVCLSECMITNVAFDFSFSSFVSNSLPVGWIVTLNIFILMMQEDQEDLVQGVGKAESLPCFSRPQSSSDWGNIFSVRFAVKTT